MARILKLFNNFTGGLLSKKMDLRVDFKRYQNGCSVLDNFKILPQGAIQSRQGFLYKAEVKDSSKKTRLLRFQFNTADTYVIEMGHNYFRFFKNGAQIMDGGSPYELAHGYGEDDLEDIRYTQSADIIFLFHKDYPVTELGRTSDTNWSITDSDFQDGPYLPINTNGTTLSLSAKSGTVTVTASTSIFSTTDTSGTGGTGQYDRLIRIKNRRSPQSVITAITAADPARVTVDSGFKVSDGSSIYIDDITGMTELNGDTYEVDNVESVSSTVMKFDLKDIDSSGFTTYSSGGDISKLDDKWIWLKITGYTSGTVVTAEIQDDETFGDTGPYEDFRLGAWSDTTGYPYMGKFYENRLVVARTRTKTDTIWASGQDDYTGFGPGTDDDDPWEFTLLSDSLDAIQWMSPQKQLRVGTLGAEYTISGASVDAAITPTSVKVQRETGTGSAFVEPLLIQNSTLFWQRAAKRLREFVFSFDVDGFLAPDISIASESISSTGVAEMVHQSTPDGIVWIRRTDGRLIGLTYLRDQEVLGWHSHTIGGLNSKVKSLVVTPASGQDELWAIIERTIDGSTVQYIEALDSNFQEKTINQAIFSDSAISYTGEKPAATLTPAAINGNSVVFTAGSSVFSASDVGREIRSGTGKAIITAQGGTTATANIVSDFTSTDAIASGDWTLSSDTMTGLDHLEGETISILADGGVHPQRVVSGGSVTLDGQYTTVHMGLPYTQRMVTMNLEGASPIGSTQGSRGRVTELILKFIETVGAKYGIFGGTLTTLDFRVPSDPQDEGVPLFDGFKEVRPRGGYKNEVRLEVVQDQPLPMTLLGYIAKIETSDSP